jgi:hypothetical protein
MEGQMEDQIENGKQCNAVADVWRPYDFCAVDDMLLQMNQQPHLEAKLIHPKKRKYLRWITVKMAICGTVVIYAVALLVELWCGQLAELCCWDAHCPKQSWPNCAKWEREGHCRREDEEVWRWWRKECRHYSDSIDSIANILYLFTQVVLFHEINNVVADIYLQIS